MKRAVLGGAAIAALTLSGCSGDAAATPEQRLATAVEELFADESWGWELSVDADRAALESMDDGEVDEALLFLEGFRAHGVVDGQSARFAADVLGVANIVEVAVVDGDAIYARANVDQIATLAEVDPPNADEVIAELADLELDPAILGLIRAALAGDWVGLTGLAALEDEFSGGFGTDAPMDLPSIDPTELQSSLRRTFGDSPGEFLARFASVIEIPGDGQTVFEVTIQLRDLAETFEAWFGDSVGGLLPSELPDIGDDLRAGIDDVPDTVPLTMVVRDGALAEVRVDVVEIARAAGETIGGTFLVVVGFDPNPAEVTAPANATTVTAEQVAAAVQKAIGELFNPFADFEFPSGFPTDFPFTEFPTEFPTGFFDFEQPTGG